MKKVLVNLIMTILIIVLALVITFSLFIYYRGNQPMDIKEARGITMWQLFSERWNAWKETDEKISELPGYSGCKNDILRFAPINFKGAVNYTIACLFPESELANAFYYWQEHTPDEYLPLVQPISWFNAPDFFWDYFEKAYWRGLVVIDYQAGACSLGEVNFDQILAEGN